MNADQEVQKVEVNADSLEALADNIKIISDSVVDMKRVLNERAIIMLIQDCCGYCVLRDDVRIVLNAMQNLDSHILTPEARKKRSGNGKK